jgi:hypothetical protein
MPSRKPHDIPILLTVGIFKRLGLPAVNARNDFATIRCPRVMENEAALHKATKAISQHWKVKNSKRPEKQPDVGGMQCQLQDQRNHLNAKRWSGCGGEEKGFAEREALF